MTTNTPHLEFVDEPVKLVSTTTLRRAEQSLAMKVVEERKPKAAPCN